jgi:hypothetical protein
MAFRRFVLATFAIALAGCSAGSSPTAPTPSAIQTLVARASADPSGLAMERALSSVFDGSGAARPMVITFPPRNEPMEFRAALDAKYRDALRRSSVETYVDQEGTVVWTQEYLRYRVNFCAHADAVSRVMSQIDGQGIAATCGNATIATFPPRNESFAFMALRRSLEDGRDYRLIYQDRGGYFHETRFSFGDQHLTGIQYLGERRRADIPRAAIERAHVQARWFSF